MTEGTLNADGWGAGWFVAGRESRPATLKGTQPIWSDENVAGATWSIASGAMLAAVRGASLGSEVSWRNTPPFVLNDHLFAHNGRLWPWPSALARALRARLDPADDLAVRGTTDSELLGGLWCTQRRQTPGGDVSEALGTTLRLARDLTRARGGGISATVLIVGASGLLAARFADPGPPPSLYMLASDPNGGGGTLLASEPLDDRTGWREVPPMSLVRVHGRHVAVEPIPR